MVSAGGVTVGGADDVVTRIFPSDRRTGTGGGVEGRFRRGVCDCLLSRAPPPDETFLLGRVDWTIGIGIRGGGNDNCSRGASIDAILGTASELSCIRFSDNWLSQAGCNTRLLTGPSEVVLSTEAEEEI